MDRSHLASYFVVAVATVLYLRGDAIGQQSGGPLAHPGRVLDILTDDPVSASVKAWPRSEQTGTDGDCVMYGDAPLDSKLSDGSSGGFELTIESAQRTYTVAYCASGYHTRVDRDLPNSTNGTPVSPTPARLWPVAEPTSGSTEYADEVIRRAVIALNELAYLRSLNDNQFQSTMSGYIALVAETDKAKADVLSGLTGLTSAWGQ